VKVAARRTVTVRLRVAPVAGIARQGSPARRLRVKATGGISASL
jgi:hypothetical protein